MTPHLYESHIKEKFLTAMNQVLANKTEIIENCLLFKETADKTNQNADPKTKHNANKK